jgi:uncharacterized membrane protein (DUF441 family)
VSGRCRLRDTGVSVPFRALRCHNPGIRRELIAFVVTFLAATGIALLAGAKNLGTALTFGQIAFAAVLVLVLVRGRRAS